VDSDIVKKTFENPELFSSCVLVLLFDKIGPEVVDWEPESIYTELYNKFHVNVTELLANKINASLALVGTDLYYKSLEAFISINNSFNFKYTDTSVFTPSSLEDIIWGVTEARFIEGSEEFDAQHFSHDIARYVAQMLSAEGMTKPPTILKFDEYDPTELDNRDLVLASDPIIAQTYWKRNDELLAGLNTFVVTKLKKLFEQLHTLPVEYSPEAKNKLQVLLTNMEPGNEPLVKSKSTNNYFTGRLPSPTSVD